MEEKLLQLVLKYPNDASLGEMLRRFALVANGSITDKNVIESVDKDFEMLLENSSEEIIIMVSTEHYSEKNIFSYFKSIFIKNCNANEEEIKDLDLDELQDHLDDYGYEIRLVTANKN